MTQSNEDSMESIREIFRIGPGPSSSHTMGPKKAAEVFKARYPQATAYRVTLYGSLAATGRGHQTDQAIRSALAPTETRFDWQRDTVLPRHPNAMKFEALGPASETLGEWTVYSIGGGKITDFETESEPAPLYEFTTTETILAWQRRTGKSFWEYVVETEGTEIFEHLDVVWQVMGDAIARGLEQEGVIPGGLRLNRKAASYYAKAKNLKGVLRSRAQVFAYALAVAEENATGGEIVTAPTCGACGVLPAVLKLLSDEQGYSEKKIIRTMNQTGHDLPRIYRETSAGGMAILDQD